MGETISLSELNRRLDKLLADAEGPLLVAIDGPCGSGKSTLARQLADERGAALFHMDDYYLPFERRIPDWKHVPGANMDFERLRDEVLDPLKRLKEQKARPPYPALACAAYRPREGRMIPAAVQPGQLNFLEGSYCLFPQLEDSYDMRLFLDCPAKIREQRLRKREGAYYEEGFVKLWIPLEQAYHSLCRVRERALILQPENL